MVDEGVTADSAAMEGDQMSVEAGDDGHEVAGILDGVCVRSGFLLDTAGTVGDRSSVGHDLVLGLGVPFRGAMRCPLQLTLAPPAAA
jgi:hypothetical protein